VCVCISQSALRVNRRVDGKKVPFGTALDDRLSVILGTYLGASKGGLCGRYTAIILLAMVGAAYALSKLGYAAPWQYITDLADLVLAFGKVRWKMCVCVCARARARVCVCIYIYT
jgi:hypothetical protein